ncbi:DUF4209 domain-containing protein [Microbacterium sp. AG790]|uniref:DUF4209 domain-containing protein n=1 Tax=Microbacterium sp. AG790 TaxID=2183995 RepID=UPI0011C41AB8|nr:DUF4209 domain-containing protein [Microbacterium sp. AG790]
MSDAAREMFRDTTATGWHALVTVESPLPLEELGALAQEVSSEAAKRGLGLIATVAGMALHGDDWFRPYHPAWQMDGQRSLVPEDFSDEEVEFLSLLADQPEGSQLSARLADIVYLRTRDRADRYRWAKLAVERWVQAGITDALSWEQLAGWSRAANIAARFRLVDLARALTDVGVDAFNKAHAMGALRVAQTMREARYVPDNEHFEEQLESLVVGDIPVFLQNVLLEEAIRWTPSSDEKKKAALRARVGDLWWDEAELRQADSHMVARDHYANALRSYRAVPARLRDPRTVDRINRLPAIVRQEGERTLDEMHLTTTDGIDISEWIEGVEAIADADSLMSALVSWIDMAPLDTLEHAKEQAREQMAEHPIAFLFGHSTIDEKGRKVYDSRTAVGRMGVPADVWSVMVRNYQIASGLLCQSHIVPGIRKLSTRWRPTLAEFRLMVETSPFVPLEIRDNYARGLFHGYYGHHAESVHLLAPAIEACVRSVLQQAGIETSLIKDDDTESEIGLTGLLDQPGADEALDVDVSWNIRAIFADPMGQNLRNRVAHGLVSSDESQGEGMLTAWWFAFRLAFVPYFNALSRTQTQRNDVDREGV